MQIRSTMLPPIDGVGLMVLDTLAEGKLVFVGLAQGEIRNGEPHTSEIGQRVLDRLGQHLADNSQGGALHFFEIKRAKFAQQRVRQALATAHERDAVLFVCADGKVYDAAFAELGFEAPTRITDRH